MEIKEFTKCANYIVYEDGKIFSLRRRIFLKPDKSKGYHRVVLNGIRYQWHRVVALTYLGDPPKGKPFVNHKDRNRTNNHKDNLEWCSQLENMQHAYPDGINLKNAGEKNKGGGKLSNNDVAAIKALLKSRRFSQYLIADLYNVSQTTISEIKTRRKWKHHS